jgi:hypothetical protein
LETAAPGENRLTNAADGEATVDARRSTVARPNAYPNTTSKSFVSTCIPGVTTTLTTVPAHSLALAHGDSSLDFNLRKADI